MPEERAAVSPPPLQKRVVRTSRAKGDAVASSLLAARAVDVAFSASPAAARKVLNQVATAKEQLFIIRTLHVQNQVDKGPARGANTAEASPAAAGATPGRANAASSPPTIHFIVGREHLDVRVKIEIIALNAEKEFR